MRTSAWIVLRSSRDVNETGECAGSLEKSIALHLNEPFDILRAQLWQ
jgi:hypothetical protein